MDKVNVMHDSEVARKRKFLKKSTIYIILMAFTIVNAYPIFWMVMNSFKSGQEFAFNPFGIPTEWIFTNYIEAWFTANIGTYFFNSLLVGIVALIVCIFVGALASYFLARFQFKGRDLLYGFFL